MSIGRFTSYSHTPHLPHPSDGVQRTALYSAPRQLQVFRPIFPRKFAK
jgi:hypothetical protein